MSRMVDFKDVKPEYKDEVLQQILDHIKVVIVETTGYGTTEYVILTEGEACRYLIG